jgi:hypothetical protein
VAGTGSRVIAAMAERFRPSPASVAFGDGIDWSSPLSEALLYVELPFWLLTPPGSVDISWSGTMFEVCVCAPWMEVFAGHVLDSRASVIHNGPLSADDWQPPEEIASELDQLQLRCMSRPCKTVLRLTVRAHVGAFRQLLESDRPRATAEQEAYRASLCEAHIPIVNELIQRYRLVTYDYVPYEVSAWDVPVWYVKFAGNGYRTMLVPYKEWDAKPVVIESPEAPYTEPTLREFEWTRPHDLTSATSAAATPGEFDLLDARSLMERGDYTGAVRRTVTALEAVLRWALVHELGKSYSPVVAEERAARTDNDFPGRLAQWRKLAQPQISQAQFEEFASTRKIRHEIVHRARRLTHEERGGAQRAVDTGRWLYNKIEGNPERARLRDFGVLNSVGRVAIAPRFPAVLDAHGITLRPVDNDAT